MKAEDNVLTVVVSNAVSDIYPQTADFTFYGGIYRDVTFIEVEECHFDLMKDGTETVFVTPHCMGKTRLDIFPVHTKEDTMVLVELKDAEGNVVGSAGQKASEHVDLIIDVKEPHLWNGMADPYCYTAVAKLVNGETVVDEVEVRYGYRSFRVDAETGFWLNGKNVPLRGVARHQDREDKGWAISKEDQEEDITAAMQIGNWFDDIADTEEGEEIEIIKGYYSIEDTIIDLMKNEECIQIMKGWLMQQGALSMVSTLEATRDMMGIHSFHGLSMFMDAVPLRNWAQANRMLNKIKK